jgi:hypothetical protein
MKLNDLLESYSYISSEDIGNVIKQNLPVIKNYIENNIKIYRGMKGNYEFILVNANEFNRPSRNIENYFNSLTTVLPSWQGWPTRNKSIICTSSINTAYHYGIPFYVIPLDNQKIAVSESYDYWQSGINEEIIPGGFINIVTSKITILLNYFKTIGVISEADYQNNPKLLLEAFDKIRSWLLGHSDPKQEATRLSNLLDKSDICNDILNGILEKGSIEFFNSLLDPDYKNILYDNISSIPHNSFMNNEIWLSGRVLCIYTGYWDQFVNLFNDINKSETILEHKLTEARPKASPYSSVYDNDIIPVVKEYLPVIQDYISRDTLIYRGMNDTGKFVLINGKKINRTSANTLNFGTMLCDILPSWRQWPKRSKSIICTNSMDRASYYGDNNYRATYVMIPLENQKIAMSNANDFWFSAVDVYQVGEDITNFNQFNYWIDDILTMFSKKIPASLIENAYTDVKSLIKVFELIYEYIVSKKDPASVIRRIANNRNFYYRHRSDTKKILSTMTKIGVLKTFDNMLNPSKNNNLYSNFTQMPAADNNEIWFTGKTLCINQLFYEEFLEIVETISKNDN